MAWFQILKSRVYYHMCDEDNTGLTHITYNVIYTSLCYIRGQKELASVVQVKSYGKGDYAAGSGWDQV